MTSYARFFHLFRQGQQAGAILHSEHAELLADLTGGKRTSLRDLTPRELRHVEQQLLELVDPREASMQRQRRKVIAILASRGCVNAQGQPDMAHIHAWVEKYGYLHQPLNDYNHQELPRLVTQAEAIVASDIRAVRAHYGRSDG